MDKLINSVIYKEIEHIISRLGEGIVDPVAYDTAWVARVPMLNDLTKPAYPEALTWLRTHQLNDGSWGRETPIYAHGNTLSTLAAILALKHWKKESDIPQIERGEAALWELAKRLPSEEHESIGFELLLPALLEESRVHSLNIPYPCYECYAEKSASKLNLIRENQRKYGSDKPATWWYSLEALGNIIPKASQHELPLDARMLTRDGSVAGSPAATAYLLTRMRSQGIDLPEADLCLKKFIHQYEGGIPHVAFVDGIELTFGTDFFVKAGMPATHPLLKPAVNRLIQVYDPLKGIGYSSNFLPDADETSLAIEILQLSGHNVSLQPFQHFFNGSYMCTYPDERHPAISINIHALTALRLFPKTPEVNQMIQAILGWLDKVASPQGPVFTDKWHLSHFYNTSRAVFALYDLNNTLSQRCINFLLEQQKKDGGWGFSETSTREETAYVSLALCFWSRQGHEISRETLENAMQFLIANDNKPDNFLWIGKVLYKNTLTVEAAIVAARYALLHLQN